MCVLAAEDTAAFRQQISYTDGEKCYIHDINAPVLFLGHHRLISQNCDAAITACISESNQFDCGSLARLI